MIFLKSLRVTYLEVNFVFYFSWITINLYYLLCLFVLLYVFEPTLGAIHKEVDILWLDLNSKPEISPVYLELTPHFVMKSKIPHCCTLNRTQFTGSSLEVFCRCQLDRGGRKYVYRFRKKWWSNVNYDIRNVLILEHNFCLKFEK